MKRSMRLGLGLGRKLTGAITIAIAAWVSLAAIAAAAPAPSPTAPAPSGAVGTPSHPLTAADVEAWADGLVPTALNTGLTPGAVVVVVKDGQVLFEKGYGYADYAKGAPVDARVTLFRPGSVSKLFTWTAVMQLVQAGKLDLDTDVNRYLDFHIPALRGTPVTLRQLMTHRAGFSETARDLLSFNKPAPPLAEVLKRYVPPRIFTPDGGPGYSNYGASLAGYIVQRVSGEPFEAYVEHHIFTPLGMAHSSFRQPLPASLRPNMSKGYDTWDTPGPGFEVIDMPPAGSLSATGDDMGRFMIAHLQLGRFGGAQILSPATAQAMHTTAWKAFPDLNGNLLGFYQQNTNGHRVIAHGGDTDYFHSDLSLFIDDGVGLFVSVNGRGKDLIGARLRDRMFHAFADRYFPATGANPAPTSLVDAATAKAHAKLMAGAWIDTRRSDSTFVRAIQLLQPTMLAARPDGALIVPMLGEKKVFIETSPFLWHEFNGPDRLQATVVNGKVIRWGTDATAPIFVFLRPAGFAGSGLELPLACAAFGFLALTALVWPIGVLARRRYGAAFPYLGSRAMAYRLCRALAWLAVVALVLWVVVISLVAGTTGTPVQALLHITQLVSLLAFAGGLAAALWNLVLTLRGPSGWTAKVFAVLLTAAFGFMLYMALAYHLIGFGSDY